jgi:MFS transporter, AAHS family, benzoate transport protein
MAEAVSAVAMADSAREAKQMRTLVWVMSLAFVGLLFNGYDLVVYGASVLTFLHDPTQLGVVTPAIAGQLGSYAFFGVLVGAPLAGSFGDILGRRKVMLCAHAWFSIGMAATALTSSVAAFGAMGFLTGLGVGALVATTAAPVSEFAPKGRKNHATRSSIRAFRPAA